MKISSKKGDKGETSLIGGVRVAKSDMRCEACGTIDEAVSALGLAKSFCQAEIRDILSSLQQDLFMVGTDLATPPERYAELAAKGKAVKLEMTQRLEDLIEDFEARIEMPHVFVIPGDSTGSAALDVARTVVRRAERRVVALKQAGQLRNEEVLRYLNRLSDLIFTLARYEEKNNKE
jgi:cob(I)alamin adenosyltransferase